MKNTGPIIVGLTGGIASGKNFVADIFIGAGAVIFDADQEVHRLLELDVATIAQVKKNFPASFINQKIDRKILSKIVFSDAKKLAILEKILHPQIRQSCAKFVIEARKQNNKIAVLNIPLLLEGDYECDVLLAILAAPSIRKKRFIARQSKGKALSHQEKTQLSKKFDQIAAKQLTNQKRKTAADFVVNTNTTKSQVIVQVQKILKTLHKKR